MNKAQLIEELTNRLGDKKAATQAVDEVFDVIVRAVNKGDKVNITGFGVFEKRARAARIARNPRTGESVRVKKTNVPAFRAGSTFKDVISGAKKLPRATAASKSPARATASTRTAATTSRSTTTRAAAVKPAATRRAAATTTRAKAAPKTAAKKTTAKAAPKAAAKKTTAKAAPRAAAKKAPAKRGKK